eukprot:m.2987 g.2987  ORF g.2987 m.2987 type:complete len:238 (+) comp8999_c0_seq1:351-1064(+)
MGELEGCAKCIKWLHFAFNVIFWVIGVAVLGLGIWLYVEFGGFLGDLAGLYWLSAPIILIVVGCIITLLGFLGCCGAVTENKHCLYAFGSLLIIVLALEIAAGALGYVKRNDLDTELPTEIKKSQNEYSTNDAVKKAWDTVQDKFTCCGTHMPSDWVGVSGFGANLPTSCCGSGDPCTLATARAEGREGCYDSIKKKIEDNIIPVGIAVIILGCIQIVGIIFSFYLACKLSDELKHV